MQIGRWAIGDPNFKRTSSNTLQSCQKCTHSKTKRICVIDEDQASCRACREVKIGCDRKPKFVFDLTKHEFFPSYEQFLVIFQNKAPGRLRRYSKPIEQRTGQRPSGRLSNASNEFGNSDDFILLVNS